MESMSNNSDTPFKILSINKVPKTLPNRRSLNSELITGRHNGKSRQLVKEIIMQQGYTSSIAERLLTDIENGE